MCALCIAACITELGIIVDQLSMAELDQAVRVDRKARKLAHMPQAEQDFTAGIFEVITKYKHAVAQRESQN